MERTDGIDEQILLNNIALMQKALEFYSLSENYIEDKTGKSPIERDSGYQAKFALDQVKSVIKYQQNLMDEMKDYMKTLDNSEEESVMNEKLNKIKNIINNWQNK